MTLLLRVYSHSLYLNFKKQNIKLHRDIPYIKINKIIWRHYSIKNPMNLGTCYVTNEK